MNSDCLIKHFFYLYAFLSVFAHHLTATDTLETPEETFGFREYKYGTSIYLCENRVTVDDHLKHVANHLNSKIYRLFENSGQIRKKQEKFRHLSSSDGDYILLEKEISQKIEKQLSTSYYDYDFIRENIMEYVEPTHIPKDMAGFLGIVLGIHGKFLDEKSIFDQNSQIGSCLDFYKTALLFFSYYLGLSSSSPPIFQYENLNVMASNPEFSSEIDLYFQNEFAIVDDGAWIQALQQLNQQDLDHICDLFRSIYRYIFYNCESLPKFDNCLATHLIKITAESMLSAQKNVSFNLDSVNANMFKLYIDLKNWEKLQRPDQDLHSLLALVQIRCLELMPQVYNLDDVTEVNEYALCQHVRMRNLLPTQLGDEDKGKDLLDEFEFSPNTLRRMFLYILRFIDDRAHFIEGDQFTFGEFAKTTEQIYNYLSGYIEISDLPITNDNALEYLIEIKLFDLLINMWNSHYPISYEYVGFKIAYRPFSRFYFPRTTYELRKHVLKLCPHLRSYEALTISLNPEKMRDEKEKATPGAWVEESEAMRKSCIADLIMNAQYLSSMMEQSPLQGIVVGTRGTSGSGKSTFLKRNVLPLLNDPQQIEILAEGILNPDTLKAALKKLQGDTLNTQVHEEASTAFNEVFREVVDKGGYILDRRQLTPYDIQETLVKPAKNIGHSVWLFDFDISLSASLYRILARPLHGSDPCPEYEALIDGFLSLRHYRNQVIALVCKEDSITKYELYATSKQTLIAQKINGEFCIQDPYLFDMCQRVSTLEIEEELSQVINDSSIDKAIASGDIAPEQRGLIEQWRGLTLKEAIQKHVQGSKGKYDESLFEPAVPMPFNGAEWLSDHPQLIDFIQSEHLHWEFDHFTRHIQGSFQMKLGYFIIPIENLQLLFSKDLSPAITRELTVRNDEGKLHGLRFFVHPTAYDHFSPLLAANIKFVPPSKSEFMGTPTSSFNTWLIRRVSTTDRKPFIVKMGTPNGNGDIKHLLAGDDIVKIITTQKNLDKLPDCVFFKEIAGLILYNFPEYPSGTVDSGIIIGELSDQLFTDKCKYE